MTCIVLFCTSASVTPEVLQDLNTSDFQQNTARPNLFANTFTPARLEPDQTVLPSETPVALPIDLFPADNSAGDFQTLFSEKYDLWRKDHSICQDTFAVLDDRGAADGTVVVHHHTTQMDDDTLEVMGEPWLTWRVRFEMALEIATQLEHGGMELVEEVLEKAAPRFTGPDGVFDLLAAYKEFGYVTT